MKKRVIIGSIIFIIVYHIFSMVYFCETNIKTDDTINISCNLVSNTITYYNDDTNSSHLLFLNLLGDRINEAHRAMYSDTLLGMFDIYSYIMPIKVIII